MHLASYPTTDSHTEKRNDDDQDQELMMEQIKDSILDLWKGDRLTAKRYMNEIMISWYVVNCHVHFQHLGVLAVVYDNVSKPNRGEGQQRQR